MKDEELKKYIEDRKNEMRLYEKGKILCYHCIHEKSHPDQHPCVMCNHRYTSMFEQR